MQFDNAGADCPKVELLIQTRFGTSGNMLHDVRLHCKKKPPLNPLLRTNILTSLKCKIQTIEISYNSIQHEL